MIKPHGGKIVDRSVSDKYAEQLESEVSDGPMIDLNTATYQDLINISNGRYSPIDGFMTQKDLLKVSHDMTLEDGTIWPLPIVLDIPAETAADLRVGEKAGLRNSGGQLVGVIETEEIYKYNTPELVAKIFNTTDKSHPGVRDFCDRDDFLIGGKVYVFNEKAYNKHELSPKETRVLFKHRGWETVVGFQTRNAPHRAHEHIQKSALEMTDGILIQPKLGEKKSGDYRDEIILGAYKTLLDSYYPDSRVALSVFPNKMNYAGPREAIFDALIRKNQGCTHFIIGRDHAGVGDYYGEFEAQKEFEKMADIGITPLFYSYAFYCERCDGMTSEKICPHEEDQQVHPSGTKIRSLIRSETKPSRKIMRPEVAEYIMNVDNAFVTQSDSTEGQT